MNVTIISGQYGRQTINTESFDPFRASSSSTIFKVVEHLFNEWYDKYTEPGAPMAKDIQGMYNGEGDQPAIYTKRGAIVDGIETLIEEIKETGKTIVTTKDIQAMDIEGAFE